VRGMSGFVSVQACLASIIVVALKGLFLQTKDIRTIGRVTKLESVGGRVREELKLGRSFSLSGY
jgi:hypothetical protein